MKRRKPVLFWIFYHPLHTLAIYLVLEALLPVWLQPSAWFARGAIRAYQLTLSPFVPSQCPYSPTCSQYGLESIRKFGTLRGGLLTTWRVMRCNPCTHGGTDLVP